VLEPTTAATAAAPQPRVGSGVAPGTRKVLGLTALLCASIGVIVAQLGMVAVMQGIGVGGFGFIGAMVIAFAIAMANAMAYAEMALMMPSAGSLSSYAEAALGNFPAILLVFAGYVTPALFGLPVELILANQILTQVFPIALPPFTWPVVIVVLFAGLNILGTDIFARVQTLLSIAIVLFLLITGSVALSGHGAAPLVAGPDSGWQALEVNTSTLGLLALAFWIFVGSEFVTPLIEEARNANRDLPRAMIGGLLIIFVVEMLFALGCAFYVPRSLLVSSAVPHLLYAVAVFGKSARIWFALLALVATASLMNTAFAAVPRMLWGMAMNGQVFPLFKQVSRRRGTPVVAIVFVAALPLIGLWWSGGDANAILPLTVAASVSWLLAYIMAQVSLIVLRVRFPQAPRPFRVPGYPVVPVLAIVAMGYVIVNSEPSPSMVKTIVGFTGAVLGVFAVVGAAWVKLAMRKNLFEPMLPEILS
jgi:amino acid transporter